MKKIFFTIMMLLLLAGQAFGFYQEDAKVCQMLRSGNIAIPTFYTHGDVKNNVKLQASLSGFEERERLRYGEFKTKLRELSLKDTQISQNAGYPSLVLSIMGYVNKHPYEWLNMEAAFKEVGNIKMSPEKKSELENLLSSNKIKMSIEEFYSYRVLTLYECHEYKNSLEFSMCLVDTLMSEGEANAFLYKQGGIMEITYYTPEKLKLISAFLKHDYSVVGSLLRRQKIKSLSKQVIDDCIVYAYNHNLIPAETLRESIKAIENMMIYK